MLSVAFFIVMLSFVILNVVVLSVIMLSVIILNVVMLSVAASAKRPILPLSDAEKNVF